MTQRPSRKGRGPSGEILGRGPDGRRLPHRPREGVRLPLEATPDILDPWYVPAAFPGAVYPRLRLLWRESLSVRDNEFTLDWGRWVAQARELGECVSVNSHGFATVVPESPEAAALLREQVLWCRRAMAERRQREGG